MSSTSLLKRISRVNKLVHLYDPENIAWNFRNMHNIYDARTVTCSDEPFHFEASQYKLPDTFPYKGKQVPILDFLEQYWTTGFIVIKDDAIVYENYWLGYSEDSLCISWSMAKSVISALIGIAIDEGLIDGVETIVSDLAPELIGGGYEGVRLKDVLQMSSGVHFSEEHEQFFSDINKMARKVAFGQSLNDFAANLKPERPPGTYNHYVSMDTQVLGIILEAVTGGSLCEYLQEKLWTKIGTEADAKWLIDSQGKELAFGTLNATLRDYARIGRLYVNLGNWNGKQLVPRQWVIDSTTPDAPHLMPGKHGLSDYEMGYGYQWWIPAHPKDDFLAIGIRGQSIYVKPKANFILVRTAADPSWVADAESDTMMTALSQYLAETIGA